MKREKAREQLIVELAKLRIRVHELETMEAKKNNDMSKTVTDFKKQISKLKEQILFLEKK
jgi:hypothetical protein